MEVWKSVAQAPRYEVSNLGNIRSLITGKPKKAFEDKKGYLRVQMRRVNDKPYTGKVHRLVAQAFIPNQGNLPQVNHLNGVKSDNTVSNLEWCTNKQNYDHSVTLNLHNHRRDIVALLPQIRTALGEGYILKDILDNHHVAQATVDRLLKNSDVVMEPITTLHVGRKSSTTYIYFDKSRQRWRTDFGRHKLPNRQFEDRDEALEYAKLTMEARMTS